MNDPHRPELKASHARFVRAMVASVFVAGIAALIVVGAGVGDGPTTGPASSMTPAYLHAPATDPSLPDAARVLPSHPAAAEAPAPTF